MTSEEVEYQCGPGFSFSIFIELLEMSLSPINAVDFDPLFQCERWVSLLNFISDFCRMDFCYILILSMKSLSRLNSLNRYFNKLAMKLPSIMISTLSQTFLIRNACLLLLVRIHAYDSARTEK